MSLRLGLSILVVLAIGAPPTRATDNHEYGKNEYAIIAGGLSPDRRFSLAAHGEGEFGDVRFHVWLMSEPDHRRIVALEGVGERNILDTGPNSYRASWSDDSRSVAIDFRSSRHIVQLDVYRIANRKISQVTGPSLFREIAGRDVNDDDDLRVSVRQIVSWQGANRFTLIENRSFVTEDAGFADRLGGYATISEKKNGRFAVEFSAVADCMISGTRYRVVNIRVGKFEHGKGEGAK